MCLGYTSATTTALRKSSAAATSWFSAPAKELYAYATAANVDHQLLLPSFNCDTASL
jgi:hypothetical protein